MERDRRVLPADRYGFLWSASLCTKASSRRRCVKFSRPVGRLTKTTDCRRLGAMNISSLHEEVEQEEAGETEGALIK